MVTLLAFLLLPLLLLPCMISLIRRKLFFNVPRDVAKIPFDILDFLRTRNLLNFLTHPALKIFRHRTPPPIHPYDYSYYRTFLSKAQENRPIRKRIKDLFKM